MSQKRSRRNVQEFITNVDKAAKELRAGTMGLKMAISVKRSANLIVKMIELQVNCDKLTKEVGHDEGVDVIGMSFDEFKTLKNMISLLDKEIKNRKSK